MIRPSSVQEVLDVMRFGVGNCILYVHVIRQDMLSNIINYRTRLVYMHIYHYNCIA